jgi:hypothetical protein
MKEKELVPGSAFEERRITPRWRGGVLPNAGIWLLDGIYRVAVYGTEAEAAISEDGGLLVAGVAFYGSHAERPYRGGVVLDLVTDDGLPPLAKRRAAETLGWAPGSN